jgi:hypothetical protein
VPASVAADDLVGMLRQMQAGYKATQHLLGNHDVRVQGDAATCTAYVVATHYLPGAAGGDAWSLGGLYDLGLVRSAGAWRISRMKLTVLWVAGNQRLREPEFRGAAN